MKTLEQIRKEKKEIERRLLFLQHKDRHTRDDKQACYDMNQAILKLAAEINKGLNKWQVKWQQKNYVSLNR